MRQVTPLALDFQNCSEMPLNVLGKAELCFSGSLSPVLQADDGEAEDERLIVDDQGNEGDADATDAKRQEKQEEEVAASVVSVLRCLLFRNLFTAI